MGPRDLPDQVLVGYDATVAANNAAAWAARIAQRIVLATSYSPHEIDASGPATRTDLERGREALRWRVDNGVRKLSQGPLEDLKVVCIDSDDAPAVLVCEQAEKRSIELCVLGHSLNDRSQATTGSTTELVLHRAPSSVLLARGPPGDGPILVGLGSDAGSPIAASWALALADAWGRELVAVHATGDPSRRAAFADEMPQARAVLGTWPPRLAFARATAEELPALIVLGTGSRPGWLGSVTLPVLKSVPCSVLVAR